MDYGGIGLNLTVREIAAAGQLWLRGGVLPDGRRLVPAQYMAEAVSKQIDNDGPGRAPDWCQGYGYQFWRSRHGAFRGDGASGQICVMLPEQDAVVAATGGLSNMQRELDAIWESLLPAFSSGPLPADTAGVAILREAENSQKFDLGPDGAPDASSGGFGSVLRFACSPNALGLVNVGFSQDAAGATLEFEFGDGLVDSLRAGWTAPRPSRLRRIAAGHSFEAFAKASWKRPQTLAVKVALPCTTTFLDLSLDLAAKKFRSNADNWFAHPWLNKVKTALTEK